MDRYQDNLSPEPASIHQQQQQQLAFSNCFKTPDLNTFQSYSHYQYPTPPSDTEENSQQSIKVDNTTPKITNGLLNYLLNYILKKININLLI